MFLVPISLHMEPCPWDVPVQEEAEPKSCKFVQPPLPLPTKKKNQPYWVRARMVSVLSTDVNFKVPIEKCLYFASWARLASLQLFCYHRSESLLGLVPPPTMLNQ
jgi:hypothetical protein